jgi:hypothetical protein
VFTVLIDEIPPVEQQQRYGNTAFRDWHAKLVQVIFVKRVKVFFEL